MAEGSVSQETIEQSADQLEQGGLSKNSTELPKLSQEILKQSQEIIESLKEEGSPLIPPKDILLVLLSNKMHDLALKNKYNERQNWEKEINPQFRQKYLTRTFDQIINQGFWACSDVATIYTAIARQLGFDAKYVSAVSKNWLKSNHQEEPSQHALVEISLAKEIRIYEPFESEAKVKLIRVDQGFQLWQREGGTKGVPFSYKKLGYFNSYKDSINAAYAIFGYKKWREGLDPKGIMVNGLDDMIQQVKIDFNETFKI